MGSAATGMTKILRFIIDYCSFLYAPGRFRFVDSQTSESFGGDAYLVLESDALRLRFINDRDELLLDVQPLLEKNDRTWFSIDIVQRLLTGKRQDSGLLSPEFAEFLKENLEEIENRFSGDQVTQTIDELRSLERRRAKELFG